MPEPMDVPLPADADEAHPRKPFHPNAETLEAINEAQSGTLRSFASIEELMEDLHSDDPPEDGEQTG